jgi:protein transport protein SEC61 subunit gamma-like protein
MDKPSKPEEAKKPGLGSKIKEKLKQYKRVLSVARKPDREEFLLSAKITGAGIIFLGLIGFVIFLIYYLITVPGA